MKLFVKEGDKFTEIASRPLRQETELQELLEQHSNLIPLELDPHRVVVREFHTAAGPIDHLVLDARAQLLVVETKLAKNAERRSVVGQAIDYAAQLTKYGTQGLLEAIRDRHPDWSIEEWFEASSEREGFLLKLERHLRQGRLTMLIVMDEADSRLKDAVRFLNRATHFDCLLAEVRVAEIAGREVAFVDLYGDETAEENPSPKEEFTEEEFVAGKAREGYEKEALAFLAARHCAPDHGGGTTVTTNGFWVYQEPFVSNNYLAWYVGREPVDVWVPRESYEAMKEHLSKAPEPWPGRIEVRPFGGGKSGKVANVPTRGASESEFRELFAWYLEGPRPEVG